MTDYQDRNQYDQNSQNNGQQGWQQSGADQNGGQGWNSSNGWNQGQGWNNGNGWSSQSSQDWSYENGSQRKLTRSATNRMVCGVCAGIAEYFNWDPTIVRLVWIGASLLLGAGFMGLIAYFIVAVVMPER